MLAFEPVSGLRVVADPAALDRAVWAGDERVLVLRFAPDDAFGVRAEGVDVDDPNAIVEVERGFVASDLEPDDLVRIGRHIEWSLPTERPALAQGNIAGVPAKLWLPVGDGTALVLTAAAYADELAGRLR